MIRYYLQRYNEKLGISMILKQEMIFRVPSVYNSDYYRLPHYTSSILASSHPLNCMTILCSVVPCRSASTLGAVA